MKPRAIIALIAVTSLIVVLSLGGCHRSAGQAEAPGSTQSENVAPSDVKSNGKTEAADSAKAADKSAGEASTAGKSESNSIVDPGGEGVDFPEREEIRRSYTLKPNAEVRISGINGRVEVETANLDRAEVLIVRSARKREDLQFRKINIEHEPGLLHIRTEEERKSIFSAIGMVPEGRQRVILKLPAKVQLATDGINGNVTVGAVDGSFEARGVNGKVNVAQISGGANFRGVNGSIEATFAKVSGDGIDLSGLNGNTTLHFTGEVNAEVEARGMNGRVDTDLPNVEERKGEKRYGRYEARIGTGGARIEIRGVNGNVRLLKAEKPATATAKMAGR